MRGLSRILFLLRNEFDKFNKTGVRIQMQAPHFIPFLNSFNKFNNTGIRIQMHSLDCVDAQAGLRTCCLHTKQSGAHI